MDNSRDKVVVLQSLNISAEVDPAFTGHAGVNQYSYELGAPYYQKSDNISSLDYVGLFSQYIPTLENANIFDIGCGTGKYARLMAERGARVKGIDFSRSMLTSGYLLYDCWCTLLSGGSVDLHYGSFEEPFIFSDGYFDGIWAKQSLHHLSKQNLPGVLANIASVLKPKGVMMIQVPFGDGEGYVDERFDGCCLRTFQAKYDLYELASYLETDGFDVLGGEIVDDHVCNGPTVLVIAEKRSVKSK